MKPRRRKRSANLMALAWDAGMLAAEAQQVVALRMAKLLSGGTGANQGGCLNGD
jgi:hypothetical protein